MKMIAVTGFSLLLSGCLTTGVGVGKGDTGPVSSSANTQVQSSPKLARCTSTHSTIILDLSQGQDKQILVLNELPADPLPAMRLIAQQTGCFRIANRSKLLQTEREFQRSGETSTNVLTKGQVVAADQLLLVEVILSNPNKSGAGALGALGSFFGPVGMIVGAVAGSIHTSEAGTVLTLIDARTGLQIASVVGNASGTSFGISGALGLGTGGFAALGGAGGYENTAQGKVVMGAMVDAMNKLIPLVPQMRNITASTPSRSVSQPAAESSGSRNVLVLNIQAELRKKGYNIIADGVYGKHTKATILVYQKENGLPADGQASSALLKHLRTSAR